MARKRKAQSDGYFKPFPKRLRILMDETKHTQKELAENLGLTRQAVSCYSDGKTAPDWEKLATIADFFSVSADWLIGLIPEDGPRKPNFELRAACEFIGLSEAAIGSLLECRANCGNVDGISTLLQGISVTELNLCIQEGLKAIKPYQFKNISIKHGEQETHNPADFIEYVDPRLVDAWTVADIAMENPELWKRLDDAGCIILSPEQCRRHYQTRAGEIVRDFIRDECLRMDILDDADSDPKPPQPADPDREGEE